MRTGTRDAKRALTVAPRVPDPYLPQVSPLRAFRDLDDGRHRAEFYRLWTRASAAGFTHPRSLEVMGPRDSPRTEAVRQWLLAGTRRGRDLASLVREGGGRFEDFERALLTLGEESGQLDDVLRLLGDFYTRKHRLMVWVKKQLAYPLFTVLIGCFIVPFPLLFFGSARAYALVAFTGVALLLLGSEAIVAALASRYGRKPPLARARMARSLATAVEAGLTLPRAVRLAADASANAAIHDFVARIPERQLATTSIGDSLARCPHITPELAAVLATAERTGDFSPLTRLAELYEDGFR